MSFFKLAKKALLAAVSAALKTVALWAVDVAVTWFKSKLDQGTEGAMPQTA